MTKIKEKQNTNTLSSPLPLPLPSAAGTITVSSNHQSQNQNQNQKSFDDEKRQLLKAIDDSTGIPYIEVIRKSLLYDPKLKVLCGVLEKKKGLNDNKEEVGKGTGTIKWKKALGKVITGNLNKRFFVINHYQNHLGRYQNFSLNYYEKSKNFIDVLENNYFSSYNSSQLGDFITNTSVGSIDLHGAKISNIEEDQANNIYKFTIIAANNNNNNNSNQKNYSNQKNKNKSIMDLKLNDYQKFVDWIRILKLYIIASEIRYQMIEESKKEDKKNNIISISDDNKNENNDNNNDISISNLSDNNQNNNQNNIILPPHNNNNNNNNNNSGDDKMMVITDNNNTKQTSASDSSDSSFVVAPVVGSDSNNNHQQEPNNIMKIIGKASSEHNQNKKKSKSESKLSQIISSSHFKNSIANNNNMNNTNMNMNTEIIGEKKTMSQDEIMILEVMKNFKKMEQQKKEEEEEENRNKKGGEEQEQKVNEENFSENEKKELKINNNNNNKNKNKNKNKKVIAGKGGFHDMIIGHGVITEKNSILSSSSSSNDSSSLISKHSSTNMIYDISSSSNNSLSTDTQESVRIKEPFSLDNMSNASTSFSGISSSLAKATTLKKSTKGNNNNNNNNNIDNINNINNNNNNNNNDNNDSFLKLVMSYDAEDDDQTVETKPEPELNDNKSNYNETHYKEKKEEFTPVIDQILTKMVYNSVKKSQQMKERIIRKPKPGIYSGLHGETMGITNISGQSEFTSSSSLFTKNNNSNNNIINNNDDDVVKNQNHHYTTDLIINSVVKIQKSWRALEDRRKYRQQLIHDLQIIKEDVMYRIALTKISSFTKIAKMKMIKILKERRDIAYKVLGKFCRQAIEKIKYNKAFEKSLSIVKRSLRRYIKRIRMKNRIEQRLIKDGIEKDMLIQQIILLQKEEEEMENRKREMKDKIKALDCLVSLRTCIDDSYYVY